MQCSQYVILGPLRAVSAVSVSQNPTHKQFSAKGPDNQNDYSALNRTAHSNQTLCRPVRRRGRDNLEATPNPQRFPQSSTVQDSAKLTKQLLGIRQNRPNKPASSGHMEHRGALQSLCAPSELGRLAGAGPFIDSDAYVKDASTVSERYRRPQPHFSGSLHLDSTTKTERSEELVARGGGQIV